MDIPIRSSGVFCGTLAFGRLPSLVDAKLGKSFATSKHLFTFVTVFRCQITVFR